MIGERKGRTDGYEKVTGRAVYGNYIQLPGMLHAVCRYSDIPAGKILSIDISIAEKMDGVKAIALYKDVPGKKKIGPVRADFAPIAGEEVHFIGDVIAVVAAETRPQAISAASAINIKYEPYEPVTDIEEAIKADTRILHSEYESNIVNDYPLVKGDVEIGFGQSDHILERRFTTPFQEHAYIEPESITAMPDERGAGVEIFGSIQNPHKVRKFVSSFLSMDMSRVNIKKSVMGGSFGGKDDIIDHIACRTALLCRMTGRPVQFTYSRENSIIESSKRHPFILEYKAGFTSEGKILAMEIDILADSGAYSFQTFFVTWRALIQATGPYEIEHVKTRVRGVYTNNCYTSALRGFGSPQITFAHESFIDEMAYICNLSPLDIRLKNSLKQNSFSASNQHLNEHTVSLVQALKETSEKSQFHKKREEYAQLNKKEGRFRYGIGIADSLRGCSLGSEGVDISSAVLTVNPDGSVNLISGVCENGSGLQTAFSMIACEVLGITLNKVYMTDSPTSFTPDGGPTVASRATLTGGSAVFDAGTILKKRIFSVIKNELNVNELEDTLWNRGLIKSTLDDNYYMSFEQAVERAVQKGVNLSAIGYFKGPDVDFDDEKGQGNAYFTYVYGCQVAEIKVDTYTGKIEVLKVTAAHDVGRAIHRVGVEGQIYGGVVQGMGYAVLEDFNMQKGFVKSENFDSYLLPTIKDIGDIDPIIIENPDKYGPFGAKSVGEPTNEIIAASIANALYFATGKRSYNLPLTMEQVLLGYNLKKPARQSELQHEGSGKKQIPLLSDITIKNPRSLKDALEMLSHPDTTPLAGGTDLLVQSRMLNKKQQFVNLKSLAELKGIHESDNEIIIGGASTFNELVNHRALKKFFPILREASLLIGSNQIRNQATLGGNLVNGAPCGDSIPPLLIYSGKIRLVSQYSERILHIKDFFQAGYKTVINNDEILHSVILQKPQGQWISTYEKLGRRNALNITRVSLSMAFKLDEEGIIRQCRIVDGALFSFPSRQEELEQIFLDKSFNDKIEEEAVNLLSGKIEDAIGKRWSGEFKKPVFINIFKENLNVLREAGNHE